MSDATKWCPRCEAELPISEFYVNQARPDGLSPLCVMHHREAGAESRRRLRDELLGLLGRVCKGCGFSDARALQVDHVKGGGSQERIVQGVWSSSRSFVERVREHPDEYQLLCANCNIIKRIEEKEHRRDYDRQTPTEKLQGIGRGNTQGQKDLLASFRTTEHQRAAARAANTPELRAIKSEKVRKAATGRRLVTGPDGKRHWERP